MLSRYFTYPKIQRRMQEGPLGRYTNEYTVLLDGEGYSRQVITQEIHLVADWSRWIQRHSLETRDLDSSCITRYLRDRHKYRRPGHIDHPALSKFLAWLCGKGIARSPVRSVVPNRRQQEVEAFRDYLCKERGLCSVTVRSYLPLVRWFLDQQYGRGPICLSKLCAKDVIRYIQRLAPRLGPARKAKLVTAMRSFLRYLRHRGVISKDLAAAVPKVAYWKLSALPKFIETSDVRKVLRACERTTSTGRRDYAVLLLLARLGLRGGEIVRLTLDDIDWDAGELTIRGKRGALDRLPLPHDVGQAIAAYLKKDRPPCQNRNIFVRRRAPIKAFGNTTTVSNLVARAVHNAGIPAPQTGSQLFRHSLATGMLRRGASLLEIGQLLRHRLVDTTAVYAKVDLNSLRGLVRPWLGGAL